MKTKFLIQVVSKAHSHKKPKGEKKKVMQTHTGSRGQPFHAFEFCNLYLWLKAKAIKVNRNLESVVDTKVLEQGFQPKLYTESTSQGLFSVGMKKEEHSQLAWPT